MGQQHEEGCQEGHASHREQHVAADKQLIHDLWGGQDSSNSIGWAFRPQSIIAYTTETEVIRHTGNNPSCMQYVYGGLLISFIQVGMALQQLQGLIMTHP